MEKVILDSNKWVLCILLFCISLTGIFGADYYVALDGNDTNDGSISTPFRTIQQAVSVLTAGDTCYIRGGKYHEAVTGTLKGTETAPIMITNYPGEEVVLDGTIEITALWHIYFREIYIAQLDEDIFELFQDDEWMVMARWPNANFDDGSIWDRDRYWAKGDDAANSNGLMVDSPHDGIDLAAQVGDVTGAMAVLNIGQWKSWARKITSHTSFTNSFTYNPAPVPGYQSKLHHYYIEGKLNLLDTAKEWYYDKVNKQVYFWPPQPGYPAGTFKGRTIEYALNFFQSEYVTIKGIDFFASAFRFTGSKYITIEDCDFNYAGYSKRMLGDEGEPVYPMINPVGIDGASMTKLSASVVRNCTFRNHDSAGLYMGGTDNIIENCYFENIDFSVTNLPRLMSTIYFDGSGGIFRRNTVKNTGASSALAPGNNPLVEYNDMSQNGLVQSDGALVQLTIPQQTNSIIRYNWFHDTIKYGARFDAENPPVAWGNSGVMHHNVGWNTYSALMFKGEYHGCYNNVAFENGSNNDIIVLDDTDVNGGANLGTEVKNNMAGTLSGHRTAKMAVPGVTASNWNSYDNGLDIRSELRDPDNLDFRLRNDADTIDTGVVIPGITDNYLGSAPEVGAYEWGDTNYWIPGYQAEKASQAIPPNNRTGIPTDADLMWLGGYKGTSYKIYLGTSNNPGAFNYRGEQSNNLYDPGMLDANTTYYWRIDTVGPNGSVTGDTWTFTTGSGVIPKPTPGPVVYYPEDDAFTGTGGSANTNYGSQTTLRIRNINYDGYIKFTVTTENIQSAILKMKSWTAPIIDTEVYAVSGNWDESTLTYNNNTLTWGNLIGTNAPIEAETWYEWDLSSYITGPGTYTIGLKTTDAGEFRWYSKESGASSPVLNIYASSGNSTPTPTPTPTGTITPTATAGTCSLPAYDSGTVYTGGNQVHYNGHDWKAKWWTRGEAPSTGGSGVWEDLGECGVVIVTPTNTPTVTVTATITPTPTVTFTPTATFTPTVTPTTGTNPEWQAGVSYSIGDIVTYGSEYTCTLAHTSLTGWEPPNVPALWSLN